MLFKRVESDVGRFEHGRFVSVGDSSGEFLFSVGEGTKEDGFLPGSDLGEDGTDDGRGWGSGEVEHDLPKERSQSDCEGLWPCTESATRTHLVEVTI